MCDREILDRVLVPVASEEDAAATAGSIARYLDSESELTVIHVIEKAGGAPDKAGLQQRKDNAKAIFDTFEATFGSSVPRKIIFDTDVASAIFDAAADIDASAIVFTPRGGSRWIRLLSGDVALSLVTDTDRPMLVLPDVQERSGDGPAGDESPGTIETTEPPDREERTDPDGSDQ